MSWRRWCTLELARGQALRRLPVDRLRALLLEQLVGLAERARAEEPVARRERARVRRLDARHRAEQRLEVAGVATPEDRHQRATPRGQRPDRLLGDLLPALALVRVRLARLDGERPVQQQHAVLRPGREGT